MLKIAMVGNFTQSHCSEVHWAATLEDMSHMVTRIQENTIKEDSLIEQVQGHDLFLWVRTWPGFVTHAHLDEIRKMGIPSVNLHLDLFIGLQRGEGLDTDPRWRCDFVFTPDGDPASAEIFKSKGINHFYLKAGVYKYECVYGSPRPELVSDVAFVGGGVDYGHWKEWPYRRRLVTWLKNTFGSRYAKYGHPEPTMRNQDLNDLYASAKVVVGDSLCPGFTKPNFWSDRVYETLGRGGFLIHPYIKGMEEEFEDKKHLVYYEFGNFDQLRGLIDHYLSHDDEREEIRRCGHEYVKANSTYHNRLQQALDIIFPVGQKPVQNVVNNEPVAHTDLLKINLGCGSEPDLGPEWRNVDWLELPGVDVVHNLLQLPYPFEDGSAKYIKAIDLLEHLPNYTPDNQATAIVFVEECHRILAPGGELVIQVPHWNSPNMWIDPSHVRGFDPRSMDYFDPDTDFGKWYGYYSKCKFRVSATEANGNVTFTMVKR